ncbi:ectonucleoside triphosphate diphosphohydrolase 5-like [Tubulanus polymorphus]|uniref:ectonucleoside triphosphate diphosphohydrolase 5-like n=1 Tax=Tubulanus polymorphus TaxID=672921 RepID=UPI003DA62097
MFKNYTKPTFHVYSSFTNKKGGIMDFVKNSRFVLVVSLGFLVIVGYYMVRGSGPYDPVKVSLDASMPVGVANATRTMYVIMFDAGSTGSRIHAYEFVKDNVNNKIDLKDELFEHVKPGLSSYADDAKAGAESLRTLVEKAKKYIPQDQWASTPQALKATAGLRLLEKHKADNILNEVRDFMRRQPFQSVENVVEIMGGTDEGVYSWFTINFLKGHLANIATTAGVIDLGGGSVQVTFIPREGSDTKKTAPKSHLHRVPVMKRDVDLYTHSYLGLGLMSARMQIFGRDPDAKSPTQSTSNELHSPCIAPAIETEWEFQGNKFTVRGTDDSNSFELCYKAARAVVVKHKVFSPVEIRKDRPFNLISYFFDKAADAGLIDEEKGGHLTLEDFSKAAAKLCANHDAKRPFLCMDLSYITALLRDGWRFEERTQFSLEKKIKGIETAWTLGAAYQLL